MPQSATHAREYETIYILRPDVDAEGAEKVQQRVYEVVQRENGQMVKLESWGRRKLAYPVKKHRTGVYFYARFVGKGGLVQELERNLKFVDTVMKYQTVLLDENVELANLQIDAEEAKLKKIELANYVAEDEPRERVLGLITDEPRERHTAQAEGEGEGAEAAEGEAEAADAEAKDESN